MREPGRAAPRRGPPSLAGRELRGWLVFGVVAVLAWEVGSRFYDQPYLLPAPSQMARELGEQWRLVLDYTLITTKEVVLGFALGSVAALLGAVLSRGRSAQTASSIVRVVKIDLPRPRHLDVKEEVAFFEKVREGREALREA
jgi:ABC-type nitrate/sulfonate/bicarbonate transport system permease component